jgi:hypothetical protein
MGAKIARSPPSEAATQSGGDEPGREQVLNGEPEAAVLTPRHIKPISEKPVLARLPHRVQAEKEQGSHFRAIACP